MLPPMSITAAAIDAIYLPDHLLAHPGRVAPIGGRDTPVPDVVWRSAAAHALAVPGRVGGDTTPREPAVARFGWCDAGLLLRVEMTDSHVTTTASGDNQHHYKLGDTVEWFLKPPPSSTPLSPRPASRSSSTSGASHDGHYWECYATPTGHRTAMFWPRADRTGVDPFIPVDGMANLITTTATGWTADLLIPASMLTRHGDDWGPDAEQPWTTLAARYNHALPPLAPPSPHSGQPGQPQTTIAPPPPSNPEGLADLELSSFPRLSQVNFHLAAEYAPLRCVR